MNLIATIEQSHRKPALPQVQSGDTVRVHQVIREGSKQRIQIFEGVVIRTHRPAELTANITVRRIASGVGVEKTFLLHSPNVTKVDILRRAKVRRSFLSYLRARRGKSARLQEVAFNRAAANDVSVNAPAEEAAKAEEIESVDQVHEDAMSEVVESTDDLAKAENKAAAADDAGQGDSPADDEEATKADTVESGVAKADDEDDRNQAKES